jgi:multisubunit Na+/H+ antiporter MnhF subunit
VGIHNALLNGWAMLGIFWLLFFTFPFIGFAFRSLYRKNLPQRIVAVSILAIIFLNMMFHSYVPTLNDVVFYIALSMLIVLQKFAKEVS